MDQFLLLRLQEQPCLMTAAPLDLLPSPRQPPSWKFQALHGNTSYRASPSPPRRPPSPHLLSFLNTDVAPGCRLLLVLMTVAPSGTGAVPVPSPLGALPGARGCHMAQFKSLSPQELQAFKRAKDAFEESLLQKDWNCSSRLFPRTRDLRQLQVWERPVALEAELALTLNVLEATANSSLDHILDQPLHTLHHIHSKLQACVPARPTAGPRPRGRLHHWLHRLQEAPKKESRDCLEASVVFNLFRLLTRDLKCVASGDQCV
ncbi:interferon lambda-3 [Tursiops truncatus]|uniref:interferon lambda-3 n=1 Tax=Tursiops truncatus TaxID=9739 RepID=UPI003CCFCCA6